MDIPAVTMDTKGLPFILCGILLVNLEADVMSIRLLKAFRNVFAKRAGRFYLLFTGYFRGVIRSGRLQGV